MDQHQGIPTLSGFDLMDGFHELESDMLGPFVWTKRTFRLSGPKASNYLALKLCYYGSTGKLYLKQAGRIVEQVRLYEGWHRYAVSLASVAGAELDFELNEVIPVPGDSRELGLMIRQFRAFDDPDIYKMLAQVLANKQLNQLEFAQGRIVLRSTPRRLIVNITTYCDMKPTCVYCEQKWARNREKLSALDFSYQNLGQMGRFYRLAEDVIDASHGESVLHKDFACLVAEFDRAGKYFEVTTNGHSLQNSTRQKILGKDMALYVSIDAASAQGYEKYRGQGFDQIITDLKNLCREKKQHHNLPVVIVTYIAMRSNRDELPQFLDLMKDVGVDLVKIRSLDIQASPDQRITSRFGFRFDYDAEVLDVNELEDLGEQVKIWAEQKGVNVILELDCGNIDRDGDLPLCLDPWQTINVLKRGLIPCCFAKEPVVPWSAWTKGSLEEFLAYVYNSQPYQQLRTGLAQGKLPQFCLDSPNCPIAKKLNHPSRS